MYSLVHQKANALAAMKMATEEMIKALPENPEDTDFQVLLDMMERRNEKIQAVNQLDRRIAFLQDSGYISSPEEEARIALEQSTIRALLEIICAQDESMMKALEEVQERLKESLKEVKDGQRSIQAYVPSQEEEGRQVDTLR